MGFVIKLEVSDYRGPQNDFTTWTHGVDVISAESRVVSRPMVPLLEGVCNNNQDRAHE